MGSDSDLESTSSAYNLDNIRINQGTVHEVEDKIIEGANWTGEEEGTELQIIDEEEGDERIEEGANLGKIEETEVDPGEKSATFDKIDELEEVPGGGLEESKEEALEE